MKENPKIISVILAGGKGQRFWPLSRESKPKQVLKITSESPMIVETYKRLKKFGEVAIVANRHLCEMMMQYLPKNIIYIIEPLARSTAPALGLAAHFLQKKFGRCILIVEAVDHFYKNIDQYNQILNAGVKYVKKKNKIVILGIKPNHAHTGYGYIELSRSTTMEKADDMFASVNSFKEKPDLKNAKKFVKSGHYYWNSGVYIVPSLLFIHEIQKILPNLHLSLARMSKFDFSLEILNQEFEKCPNISIEYGVFEKSKNLMVMKSSMHWDDIGDFNAFARLLKPDEKRNYTINKITTYKSEDNIIVSEKLVVLIGVENLVVVDTPDALLICNRKKTQDIKKICKNIDRKYL
jgi:mannose-1-phosphate guanylyltransferase